MLTQAELKRHIHYDPETGVFTRIAGPRAGKAVANSEYADKYLQIGIGGRAGTSYLAQRLAVLYMTGRELTREFYVDHINGVCNDNRWVNLRVVNHIENQRNTKRPCTNTSGVCGVSLKRKTGKWVAQIGHNSGTLYLGLFSDFAAAVERRKFAEMALGYHPNHGRIAA